MVHKVDTDEQLLQTEKVFVWFPGETTEDNKFSAYDRWKRAAME